MTQLSQLEFPRLYPISSALTTTPLPGKICEGESEGELTVLIRPMISPVDGHLDSTIGPLPLHCPSNTPGMDPSTGRDKAERTRLALEERHRLDTEASVVYLCNRRRLIVLSGPGCVYAVKNKG